MIFILALCLPFSVIENLCSLGRASTERSEFDIREHRSAELTPNARVCLHAESSSLSMSFFIMPATSNTQRRFPLQPPVKSAVLVMRL